MIGGIKKIGEFVRKETVLTVALLLAVISAFIVPPDSAYVDYIDFRTLAILFCLMTVVAGFSQQGMFGIIAKSMINRMGSLRAVTIVLIFMCFFFSMFITNDVSLITFVPMTLTVLGMAGEEVLTRWMVPVITLQTIAANLGSMLTPIGNPQNLYLYSYYGLHLGDFLRTMALPFALSTAGVVACTWWLCGHSDCNDSRSDTHNTTAPMPLSRRSLVAYGLLLALTLLAVFHIVPIAAAVVIVAATLAALDRRALVAVDWGLLATFACFFVFAGNMARVPEVSAWLSPLMADHGLLVSAGLSQIISNVPAAVLLSHFAGAWQPLLIGVNIGGAGTLVGSLASLITLQHFTSVRKVFPQTAALPELSTSRFLILFSVLNFAFLAILLIACGMTSFF